MEDVGHVPVRVRSVRWEGAERSRADFLARVAAPIVHAHTLAELTAALSAVAERTARLDVFHAMPRFAIAESAAEDGTGDAVDVDVVASVREKRASARAGADVQPGGVGVGASATLYNALGRGERVDVRASHGPRASQPLSLSIRKPILPVGARRPAALFSYVPGDSAVEAHMGTSTAAGLAAPWDSVCRSASLSYDLRLTRSPAGDAQGVLGAVLPKSIDARLRYGLEARCMSLRESLDAAEKSPAGHPSGVSTELRREAGRSIKSAVSLALHASSLDDALMPVSGGSLRAEMELAGLGGNARFLRTSLALSRSSRIHTRTGLTLHATARAAAIVGPPGGTTVFDRLHAGGPLSVRGVPADSVGPRDSLGAALGGARRLEFGLRLSVPLIGRSRDAKDPLASSADTPAPRFAEAHVFANTAAVMSHGQADACTSVGAGIAVRIGDAARIELNIAAPIADIGMGALRSAHIGIGADFL